MVSSNEHETRADLSIREFLLSSKLQTFRYSMCPADREVRCLRIAGRLNLAGSRQSALGERAGKPDRHEGSGDCLLPTPRQT